MDLILWRHADARDPRADEPDVDRPLTGKGERHAERMARWLHQHLPHTTRVLVSPALRTRQTADALKRPYKVVPALGPEGTVDALLQAARWPDGRAPVLVVGHQPTLGQTVAYLLAGATDPWTVRKGAIWWLRRRTAVSGDGRFEVLLQTVLAPDRL